MIGQSQVTEPLMTALRTGRVGHAYLFSGPRGCGKTTSARILARCLNCAEGPTDVPCGTCPSCVELSRDGGGSLDVVEIDAASHGGVDDARDLRERAVFAPARDRFKIFIIDEAHMVTPGGFNALLKIVEEPPPHVKFIFATTEPDKVIGTIRSRTHHYPFRLIAPATLIDYVQTLCDSEGVQVEPGVLPLVVRAGGGSARDTLSILDQLIAGSEGNLVTSIRAAGLLGFTHTELLDDVVVAFGTHDAAAAFQATDRVVQTGQDPRRFVEDLLERLRDLIVVTATTVEGAAAVFRGVPQDQLTRMFEQAQAFGPGELSRIADTVSATLDKMVGATAPRLQLELMIARALVVHGESAQRSAGAGVSAGLAPRQSGGQPAPAVAAQPTSPQPPARPAHDPVAALAAARGAVNAPEPAPVPETAPATGQAPAPAAPNAAQTAASIRDFLREDDSVATPPAAQQPTPQGAPQQAARAPQLAEPSSAPHPNEAAASFGRPISDVLSTSQIESIGSEPAPAPAPAEAAPTLASVPAPGPESGAERAAVTAPGPVAEASAAENADGPHRSPSTRAKGRSLRICLRCGPIFSKRFSSVIARPGTPFARSCHSRLRATCWRLDSLRSQT
nr:DNA polymerase III subunit gamma and tau [Leucobacter coleopterorum]